MKNHIAFKFIAVVLCAASLMGIVGSIAGVAVLTQSDLYNKTVEEVIEQRIQSNCAVYADDLALAYASRELGGCSESMIQAQLGSAWWFQNNYPNYGYTILDADGNVLTSYNTGVSGIGSPFSTTVTGKYMHLVSAISESEQQLQDTQDHIDAYRGGITDGYGNTVPADGIRIDNVMFVDADGRMVYEAHANGGYIDSTYYFSDGSVSDSSFDGSTVGFLFYNQAGQLVYSSFLEEGVYPQFHATEVSQVLFTNENQGFVFDLSDTDSLGTLSNEDGSLRFASSFRLEAAAAETDPTVAPTEAIAETTEAVTEPTDAPTVPEETEDSYAETDNEESSDDTYTEYSEEYTEETAEYSEESSEDESESSSEEYSDEEATEYSEENYEDESDESSEEYTAETAETAETASTEAPTLPEETVPEETVVEETVPEETEPVLIDGKPLSDYQINRAQYYDSELGEYVTAKYVYVPMPELTVELYIDQSAMRDTQVYSVLALVRQYRNLLIPAIAVCLLLFAVFAVYLCTAAGRKPKAEEVSAGGLNRLPLDLYLVGGCFTIALIIAAGAELSYQLLQSDFMLGCGFAIVATFLACLIFVGFCFAFVAQIKTPGNFWWRNSLCGRFLKLWVLLAIWLEKTGLPALGRLCVVLWKKLCVAVVWLFRKWEQFAHWFREKARRLSRWTGAKLQRFFSLIPLTWQWLLVGLFMVFLLFLAVITRSEGMLMVCLFACIAIVLYGAHCFGTLMESTRRMSKGDLDTKVDDKLMMGSFKEFAADLNDLAGVAVVAAQKQLKSERMKTELITNVSHDIKTPLTSIINYVDLLQKPHTDEEEAQYLEVLDRQSQRLKKLIDDLMDMSKASTGNMTVEVTKVDAVESVNQALGEFADKLAQARLIPVFRHDEEQVPMMADGKLVWRVLSNLLSNAVKYAMPGTRLYVDLMQLEGKVIISLKNVSREELNVDADELMERFVRGDDSRNTEGSGLGLNIAKSLMELQKGQLQLLVDGDLFKVTLIFPGV